MIRLKILRLPFQIMGYRLFRKFGWPKLYPLSIALYATYKCNSRCKTCNIWKEPPKEELTIEEWGKILKSIGKTPLWFTITGGEPFLRTGLEKIVYFICKYNRPLFINIATNGLFSDEIFSKTKKILKLCERYNIKLTINISLDEIENKYDYIRGTSKGFKNVMETIKYLKELKKETSCLNIGINITISQYNIERFFIIYNFVAEKIKPDSIISEMATNRKAFFLRDEKFSPEKEEYIKVLDFLISKKAIRKNDTANLIQYFRKGYYKLVKDNILQDKKLPCYVAIASVEISPVGDVMDCCTLAYSLGNLGENNYNFGKVWKSKEAEKIREKIKKGYCFCTLSNPYYTNLLSSFWLKFDLKFRIPDKSLIKSFVKKIFKNIYA